MQQHEAPEADGQQPTAGSRIDPAAVSLLDFFERLFSPINLSSRSPGELSAWRSSYGWMAKALGRSPMLADLTADNLAETLQLVAAAGIGPGRLKTVRTHIAELWRYAHALGIVAEYQQVELPEADPVTAPTLDKGGLADWYHAAFRPELAARASRGQVNAFDRSIVHFAQFLRDAWQGRPVSPAAVDAFCEAVSGSGKSAETVRQYRDCVNRILREYSPEVAPKKQPRPGVVLSMAKAKANGRAPKREIPAALPPAKPGALRHYFEAKFRPARLVDISAAHVENYRSELRALYGHFGRDLRVAELDAAKLGEYLHAQRQMVSAQTVNRARACLLAILRYAYHERLIDRIPHVRKCKIDHEQPDAWTVEEFSRIVAAVETVPYEGDFAAYRPWWRALLLVAWWTAARKTALLSIRREEVNLETATVYLRADASKTRYGKTTRIGPDAVAAIAALDEHLGARALLFALPYGNPDGWSNTHFGKIIAAAGIAPSRRTSLQKFHKIRRTTATAIAAVCGIGPAADALQHRSEREVTARYIDAGQMQTDLTSVLPMLSGENPKPDTRNPTPETEGGAA